MKYRETFKPLLYAGLVVAVCGAILMSLWWLGVRGWWAVLAFGICLVIAVAATITGLDANTIAYRKYEKEVEARKKEAGNETP